MFDQLHATRCCCCPPALDSSASSLSTIGSAFGLGSTFSTPPNVGFSLRSTLFPVLWQISLGLPICYSSLPSISFHFIALLSLIISGFPLSQCFCMLISPPLASLLLCYFFSMGLFCMHTRLKNSSPVSNRGKPSPCNLLFSPVLSSLSSLMRL